MDLDTYYAEQETRVNLPQETFEDYQKRLATLQQRSTQSGFSPATATSRIPAEYRRSSNERKTDPPGYIENNMKRKLAEGASEAAEKRQRIIDQEKIEDDPLMPQATSDLLLFSIRHKDEDTRTAATPLRINELGPNLLTTPQVPRPPPSSTQLEQHKRSSNKTNTPFPDNLENFNVTELKTSHGEMAREECKVPISRSAQAASSEMYSTNIPMASSCSSDGVQDDIDSFSGDISELTGSKPIRAAKVADIRQAAAEDSPIGSFSRTQGVSSRSQRGKGVVAVKRQAPLVLRPVGDTAQLFGKNSGQVPGPSISPIEEPSLLCMPTDLPEQIVQVKPFETGSSNSVEPNNVVVKQFTKRHDKPFKLVDKHAQTANKDTDRPAMHNNTVLVPSSPSSRANSPINTSSGLAKKVEKQPANTTGVKRKVQRKKEKPQPMTPAEYARTLQAKAAAIAGDNAEDQSLRPGKERRKKPTIKFLEGKNIFYTGGDMKYASETTRGRMDIIVKFGGNLMPEFDPHVTTHVITDSQVLSTLRALGLRNLDDIPDHIATVRWSWVLSVLGKETILSKDEIEKKLGDTWLHAAFCKRMDAGYRPQNVVSLASLKEKGKSRILNEFPEDQRIKQDGKLAAAGPDPKARKSILGVPTKAIQGENEQTISDQDPLAAFVHDAKMERVRDDGWSSLGELDQEESDTGSEDVEDVTSVQPVKRGWTCDQKDHQSIGDCPNQDVIDKLTELMEIHKAKLGGEDHWRAYSYSKCIRALRSYPKRIKTPEEARNIRGVGEKTARKIEEILRTGDLRRIKYEKTEDVAVTRLFQGIYGVGQSTAFQWYAAGCRTLMDLEQGKGDVKLSAIQKIGLQYYDDINNRMPREEAKAIFDHIQKIAYSIDAKLFIEIMGSYRRGKSTCGDIDILITRPTEDGKTHSGVLSRLLQELRAVGMITEDLALPDDPDDLEAVYRGLCCLPGVPNARRRRIDFLSVPWVSRGAALIYYTGDDIFNRAMRFKASAMGYSLNQRGLFGSVVRDPRDRRIKYNEGVLIASETEEEIFKMLEVPWQEPHERVRG